MKKLTRDETDPAKYYYEVSEVDTQISSLEDDMKFVERWAVHHGTKSHMTAENALSIIQHYPPITAITKGYADGNVPDTFNPYDRITELEAQLELYLDERVRLSCELADAKQVANDCRIVADNAIAEAKKYQWQHVGNDLNDLPKSGVTVLACYTNSFGKIRRIRAKWVAAKSSESHSDSDWGEYDEASDTYYDPEGWYEQIDNAVDYSAMFVSDTVTHWMPLPSPPAIQAKGKQA